METYGLPGCSRDAECFELEASAVSTLSVCFCCLASNTPLLNAITCTHTEFVQQFFTEWYNQNLLICYTCHHMLKKIEEFRRQVRESLDLLTDYQPTKVQNLNKPKLVNNLVTTDIVVTSKKPTERTNTNSNVTTKTDEAEAPIEFHHVDVSALNNETVEISDDDEPTEKIEVATSLLQPVPVVLTNKKKRRKYKKTRFTTTKQRHRNLMNKKNEPEPRFLPETVMISERNIPQMNSTTEKPKTMQKNVPTSNILTEKPMTIKKNASNMLTEKSITIKKNASPSNILTEKSITIKKNASSSNILTEKSMKIIENALTSKSSPKKSISNEMNNVLTDLLIERPTKTKTIVLSNDLIIKKITKTDQNIPATKKPDLPADVKKSTYMLAKELAKLKNVAKLSKKRQIDLQTTPVKIFSMVENFHEILEKKYDGKIKIVYLTQDELMLEREAERQKEFYLKRPFKCETCIQGFMGETRYNNHKAKYHPINRSEYVLSCDVCDTAFKSQRAFRRHLKDHVLRYVCIACGKKSRKLELLESHYKLTHTKSVKCKDCNKTFAVRRKLLVHRRQEHKKVCSYCEKVFMTNVDLDSHYRRFHPDECPIKCSLCPETFNNSSELYRHRKIVHKIQAKYYTQKMKLSENDAQNTVVMKNNQFQGTGNNQHQFQGTGNNQLQFQGTGNNQQVGKLRKTENNQHYDIEMENIGNIVHEIEEAVNTDHDNVVVMNIQHDIGKTENIQHEIEKMENIVLDNVVHTGNNELEVYETVNNVHYNGEDYMQIEDIGQNAVIMRNNDPELEIVENYIVGLDQDIEYNNLEEKEDQSCIIGL